MKKIKTSLLFTSATILIVASSFVSILHAREAEDEEVKISKEGNFSVYSSMQPWPLFGFGQTIVNKGDCIFYETFDHFKGFHHKSSFLTSSLLYGVRDDLSLFLDIPVALKKNAGPSCSSGIEDIYGQFEYALWTQTKKKYYNQATLIFGTTWPTGSLCKIPETGFGSPTFFIGSTFVHLATDWYVFASPGITLTTRADCFKWGNEFLYQFGVGKNIFARSGWIGLWMIELGGSYLQKDRINGAIDHDSGGNSLFLAPSLFFSSDYWQFQIGFAVYVDQQLNGIQEKEKYQVSLCVGRRL